MLLRRRNMAGPGGAARTRALLAAVTLATAAIAMTAPQALAEPQYMEQVADLPLMPALSEVEDAGVVFDKTTGRIVEAYAHGPVSEDEVTAFYAEVLPQLGWRGLGDGRFVREDELLEIDTLGPNGDLTVRFTLQPR